MIRLFGASFTDLRTLHGHPLKDCMHACLELLAGISRITPASWTNGQVKVRLLVGQIDYNRDPLADADLVMLLIAILGDPQGFWIRPSSMGWIPA